MSDERKPLSILILHRLGSPKLAPHFLSKLVYALQDVCPSHNYLYHDVNLPLPSYVRDAKFDAIILDVTLLAMRSGSPFLLKMIQDNYSFVSSSDAIKIAFPQDEYDCHLILDDWLCMWNVDVVYCVINNNLPVLFPKYYYKGEIRIGYTGYIDNSLLTRPVVPWDDRSIDIGYRARRLLPYFGRIGETKAAIADLVKAKAAIYGLVTDISVGDSSTIVGEKWLEFLSKCKFTLGTNSGSSLLDPRGDIQRSVKQYSYKHPNATFEEIETHCFDGLDGHYTMTAISPRIFEAALMGSCQILVKGYYNGIILPKEHYIQISEDASNFYDIFHCMSDHTLVKNIISNCRSALLDVKSLRIDHAVNELLDLIRERTRNRVSNQGINNERDLIVRYQSEMKRQYERLWIWQQARSRIVNQVKKNLALHRIIMKVLKSVRS